MSTLGFMCIIIKYFLMLKFIRVRVKVWTLSGQKYLLTSSCNAHLCLTLMLILFTEYNRLRQIQKDVSSKQVDAGS